jgi:hypothetical protein
VKFDGMDVEEIYEKLGWNDTSKIMILEEFIGLMGLHDRYHEHVVRCAEAEGELNGDSE